MQDRSDRGITSCEFAEFRLFEDLHDASEAVRTAAVAGTLSEVTIALAERDDYCLSCVRHWYSELADAPASLRAHPTPRRRRW